MKRSKFSLSHHALLTMKMGQLVPVACFEALPGDTIQHSVAALIRCAPLVTPVMHPIDVRFHTFFVPNRIMWNQGGSDNSGWEAYITGGPTGADNQVHPSITLTPSVDTLADFFGLPFVNQAYNALPFRAYSMIWNEFYRDQDLQTALTVSTAAGADSTTNTAVQNICWEKDYLTSCRPWTEKGGTVTLPLGTQAPVRGIGIQSTSADSAASITYYDTDSTSTHTDPGWLSSQSGGGNIAIRAQTTGTVGASNIPQIFADLSTATAASVNTIRHAFALQRFEEARAKYGSRYTEYLRYLGIRSSDARLQRPEYLGGGRSVIQFSEVLQTAPTTAGTAGGAGGVGQFGGHGLSAARTNRYRRFFEEHGIVMTLMSVRPKTIYSNRIGRMWMRGLAAYNATMSASKEDYFQRELQHIGQQGVNALEVDATNSETNSVFGYQDRYDEYRRQESYAAALMRTTLNTWNLNRTFAGAPSLNSTFVSCVPTTRTFADTSNDNLYVMVRHSIQARRMLAREGNALTF